VSERMMALWGLLLLSSVGCKHQQVVTIPEQNGAKTVAIEELTDKQKISLLRSEAHALGLRWRILCTDDNDERYRFLAEAEWKTKTEPFILYVEDGAQPRWVEFGKSQADAAFNLYQSLKDNPTPTHQPLHKPDFRKPKHCPPIIHGD
jgi:hypothetical protein